MTRRDYVFIAETFLRARRVFETHGVPQNTDDRILAAALAGVDYAARLMCNRLAAANPRFDRERFLRAVGL